MAAEKSDQPGVLGNLPRSRPGQRSEKRVGASAKAKPAVAKTAARKPAAQRRRPAPNRERPAVAAASASEPSPERSGSTDPLTGAVRLAGKVAEVGLKTAGGLLRRLPGR